jgi:hypothetical protein
VRSGQSIYAVEQSTTNGRYRSIAAYASYTTKTFCDF